MITSSAPRVLLAIESSCDETAAAVIDENLAVRSSVVASQTDIHQRYGGVVPEIASRAHVQRILPVIDEALQKAGTKLADLAAIAVVTHPGLVGSLLVGLTAAKTLALVLDKPLIAVNHIEAHMYACRMHAGRDIFPAVGLVVSGGHTNLYDCPGPDRFRAARFDDRRRGRRGLRQGRRHPGAGVSRRPVDSDSRPERFPDGVPFSAGVSQRRRRASNSASAA